METVNKRRIKFYTEFINEFVENSNITLDDLNKAKNNIDLLKETIMNEFYLDENTSDEEINSTYNSLLDIRIFDELNTILNKYLNKTTSTNSLYGALEQASHLVKEMIEQYDMEDVTYSHKEINSSIDKFVNDLNSVLPFAVKKISSNSSELEPNELKIVESLKKETQSISETNAIEKQRRHLDMLSKDMYALLKVSKYEEPIYYQYCPMKDSNWLSKEETIKNPYYGSQMMSCGKTVEIIEKR